MKHLFLLATLATTSWAIAAEPVTIDNFTRAETDHYLKKRTDDGYYGDIKHIREPVTVDNQPVVRANQDTLYSYGVFDLTHPVTITMPEAAGRFQSLRAINQDHYIVSNTFEAGPYVFDQEEVGTRYLYVAVRTLADPNSPEDLQTARALQDQIKVEQKEAGKLELPDWDQQQLAALRKAILGLAPFVPDSRGMFGPKSEVDPVRHLLGTAGGWAGGPEWASYYENVTPENNDGKTSMTLRVKDVPVDGFWSITVYNQKGYMEKTETNAISVNNITAKPEADGTIVVHFGGDRSQPNFLEIFPGWNYTVRLYRARPELLDGTWKFPKPQPAN